MKINLQMKKRKRILKTKNNYENENEFPQTLTGEFFCALTLTPYACIHSTYTYIIKLIKQPLTQEIEDNMREYVSGETFYLWGKPYTLNVSVGNHYGVNMNRDEILLTVKKSYSYNLRQKAMNDFYSSELADMINVLIEPCVKRVGVNLKAWNVINSLHIWGCCYIYRRTISLNLQLAMMPLQCLESVIIHELVHLIEREHTRKFYALCKKFFPGYFEVHEILDFESAKYTGGVMK